mgnify:CR=1 FL=1
MRRESRFREPIGRSALESGSTILPRAFYNRPTVEVARETGWTREQLLDEMHGAASSLDRSVDSHVKNLRKKLEKNPAQPEHLLTEQGVGYRLVGE